MIARIAVGVAVGAVTARWLAEIWLAPSPCQGICSIPEQSTSANECGSLDPKRLVFIRVPKTGSSSMAKLLDEHQKKKAFSLVRLPDYEDAVPHVEEMTYKWESNYGRYKIINGTERSKGQAKRDKFSVLQYIAKSVAMPAGWFPWLSYQKFVFSGHFYHLEWRFAGDILRESSVIRLLKDYLPSSARPLIQNHVLPDPAELAEVKQIAFVREPIARLHSQYWYERTVARSAKWRERLVAARGNLSLAACAADADCVAKNQLQQWCSLQTQFFCGMNCTRPLTSESLELAKKNMKEAFAFVGVQEHFQDSLEVLNKIFPTYLEGLHLMHKKTMPREKSTTYGAHEALDAQALKDACSLDIELYSFAVELFQQKLASCNVR